ncbi:hypothetical protein Bca52824_009105 [Brassica carinata]|uniref:separase n=1 Tax=Brassica carinata TaxID=52824 RepID=A0A8X8B9G4_BRACI|nr:hypothetical protein Bca52824_009105 [Brassica carinata]
MSSTSPPMTSRRHGSSMDSLRLIIDVSNRGGFKAVSENAAWDEVGQESGLGPGDSVSAKLIYVKYLAALARLLNSDSCPGFPGSSKDLIGRLRDFVSQAKSKSELRKVRAEFKRFLSETKKPEKIDSGNDKDRSSPGKRKRECSVETLKWLSEAAKDPCDTSNGSLPDRSKWDSYGSEEPWKQLLLFRASRTNTTDSSCQKTWQKTQKMHPSLYQDSAGTSYNLRNSLSSRFNERKARKDESCGLLCSEFQAELPDWSLIASESLMWPLNKEPNNNNRLTESDPIGNADSNKMLTMLVSAMGECAFSILREPAEPQRFLDEDSLHDFCISTLKITSCLVENVISSPWISPPELIHLCASFPVTGDNIKHSEKVSMTFKLCIRTVWNCVRLLCLKFVNVELNSSEDTKAVIDFVSESCHKSAYYLDVLQGELEIGELVLFIVENWCEAKKLITSLPDLTPIIQQWVKIQHKRHKSPDLADSCTLFHSLLSSSQKISKIVTGNILEQEILAYEEFVPVCSKLCRANQIKIADILLKDVFITKDLFLERARVLTWKARIARAELERVQQECVEQARVEQERVEQARVKQARVEKARLEKAKVRVEKARVEKARLEQECVLHLSEGISNLESIFSKSHEARFQLIIAYFLRALCIQETEPASKEVFEDINKSLNLWVGIQSGDIIPLENVIPLLFNVIDLVSIKGWIELHQRIYDLMFRIIKGRNVRLKDALAMLWDCRRLSHALCPSPIDDAVIRGLSCYFDEISESTDFWKSCLQFSKAKSIGFKLSIHESDITIDEIKHTASKLDTTSKPVSSDPFPCFSSFVAASLYYDLSERELSCGNLYKAFSYAKEANRIRQFLHEKWFRYGGESNSENHTWAGKTVEIKTYIFDKFEVSSLRDTDSWPCGTFLWDISRCYLSPWILLQCSLESALQLGVIFELMGERDRAGPMLSWGKAISCMQSLQPFVVAFSLALGNLYNKMQCWDLAEKELQNAKELLTDSQRDFTCRNCKLVLEVTLDKQFGDVSQSQSERLYSAALQKICCPAWKGCINQTAEVEKPRDSKRRRGGSAIIVHACGMKEQPSLRLTRSMSRSLEERPQNFPAEKCRFIDESDVCDAKGLMRDTKNTICVCINRISQQHLSNEVTRSGLPNSFISLKWQFYQRRLACTVLVSLGKCLAKSGKVHQAHGALLHSIAALYNSTVSILSSSSSRSPLLDFIGKEIKGDVFGLDRARILYNLCKLSLQTYHSRFVLCDLSHIPYQTLVSLLTLAFVLSREDPILCRKISRLLAVLYLVSSKFSFSCDGELSLSHWVTYYHQASLAATINYHFLSKFIKSERNSDKEASEEFDFLRLAPKSTEGLVKFAKNFFNGLPETTAICISLLGGRLSKLLQELMKSPQVCGWLLLSRLSSKSQQPLAVLLPIYSPLEEGGIEKLDKRWDSPWGSTVVDVVAPEFRLILKENYFTGSEFLMEDEKLRWQKRDELELRLNKLLRNLEDTWLGPWRHLLLAESSNNSKLHKSTQKKLVEELREKCNMEVNETLLKVFLGNDTADGGDAWISQLCSKNGCYIGSDHIDEENGTSISDDLQIRYRLALQLIRDSGIKLEDYNEKGEPIILVLDHEIQMLPWENIPTLKRQEVYRMPSVGSISAVLKKSCYRKDPSHFPVIDPRDSCYLLDPKYNCKTLQTVLEGLSEIKEIKVEAGLELPAQELNDALGNHHLFLYSGHGTGEQYIPMRKVENMDQCSAAFLMGCCSALPYRGGIYVPKSVPICFLLAGSPVIVATLWDVADDISQFEKAMLEGCWRESSDDVKPERIGSLMADSRYACVQQFLTGAAVVCYGVPTAITTKTMKNT